jgi:hypothetical protein
VRRNIFLKERERERERGGKIIRYGTFEISSHHKSGGEFELLTFKLGSLR